MSKALSNSFELGPHSDVLVFDYHLSGSPPLQVVTKFVWWNSHHRPYGFTLPLLCPICNAIHPWEEFVSSSPQEWAVQCGNLSCGLRSNGSREQPGGKISKKKPQGITFITPVKKRTNGWFAQDVSTEFS